MASPTKCNAMGESLDHAILAKKGVFGPLVSSTWQDITVYINSHNNLANVPTGSVFFGVSVESKWFWLHLLKHDKEFGAAMLKHLVEDNADLSEYTVADLIEDMKSDGGCSEKDQYVRQIPRKVDNTQCADDFNVCLAFLMKGVRVYHAEEYYIYSSRFQIVPDPHVPMSLWKGFDVEYHDDYVLIGRRFAHRQPPTYSELKTINEALEEFAKDHKVEVGIVSPDCCCCDDDETLESS